MFTLYLPTYYTGHGIENADGIGNMAFDGIENKKLNDQN